MICIMSVKNGVVLIQVGVGIVVDFVLEVEYEESCNKVGVLLKMIYIVEDMFYSKEDKVDE